MTTSAGPLVERFAALAPDSRTGERVTVAGRLLLRRVQGKVAFGTLSDWTGRIQAFARTSDTADYQGFCDLSLGDWISATGEVITTRRGELSVAVESWQLLAEARRQFPDKWHGLADPDTRYRQRYVDLVVNETARTTFLMRSRMISLIRRALEDRGFVEAETPVLHPIPGGALARPFTTHHNALDSRLYLRIAPELYLKRLVVGGFEKVFEIGRVFRNEGLSPRHNPEFTMLELYWAYADYWDLMVLLENLVADLARRLCGSSVLTYQGRTLDLTPPWRRATLGELVAEHAGFEVDLTMGTDELARRAATVGLEPDPRWGPGKLLLEIYEKTTEAHLWDPVLVCDYPAEVSPLARRHRSNPELTERFEAIVAGRELANAFSELVDPDDQRDRFGAQAAQAAAGDPEAMTTDADYIRALEYGLPPTAGLGVGIDRLAMLLADVATIKEVIFFPTLRPDPTLRL